MKAIQFISIAKTGLLLIACLLSACGKTGALYLPETRPTGVVTEPGAEPAADPGKTQ